MRSFHQVLLFVIVFVVNGVYLLPEVETEAKAEVTVIEPVRVSDFIQVEDDMVDDEENEIYNEVSEAQDEVLKDDSKGWTLNRDDQGGYDLRIQSDDALRTESVRVAKVTEAREGKEVVDEASTVDESKTVHRVKGTSSWTDKDGVKVGQDHGWALYSSVSKYFLCRPKSCMKLMRTDTEPLDQRYLLHGPCPSCPSC